MYSEMNIEGLNGRVVMIGHLLFCVPEPASHRGSVAFRVGAPVGGYRQGADRLYPRLPQDSASRGLETLPPHTEPRPWSRVWCSIHAQMDSRKSERKWLHVQTHHNKRSPEHKPIGIHLSLYVSSLSKRGFWPLIMCLSMRRRSTSSRCGSKKTC